MVFLYNTHTFAHTFKSGKNMNLVKYKRTVTFLGLIVLSLAAYFYREYDQNCFNFPKEHMITPWAKDHVQRQLSVLSKKVTPQEVQEAFAYLKQSLSKTADHVLKCSIRNGKVDIEISNDHFKQFTYYKVMAFAVKELNNRQLLKDADFIINLGDRVESLVLPSHLQHVPIFVFAKDMQLKTNQHFILIPDAYTLKSWPSIYAMLKDYNASHTWQEKNNKLFWRGQTSDKLDKTLSSPRLKFVSLSKSKPEQFDARFTKIFSHDQSVVELVKEKYGDIVPYVSIKDHLSYKYQITLDGYTVTFPGYLWRQASRCVNIKQDTVDAQWFYELFQPQVHYLAVNRDLSNIEEVMMQALLNDDAMKEMQTKAYLVVEAELTPEKILGYLVEILNAYIVKNDSLST